MHRKVAGVVLGLACTVGLYAMAGLAGQGNLHHQKASADLERAIEHYGLQVVAQAPPGVKPLVVSSVSELQRLLDSIDAGATSEALLASSPEDGGVLLPTSGGTLLRRYHWSIRSGPYRYNLDANVYIQNYGSFTWIDHISSVRFYLSGIVAGVYLKDVWTESEIDASNGQCATISGGATECWYIMIKELLTYYQRDVWMIEHINIAE